jgi:NAD(P)-dependent dehydrogenase (short-subunit alcohol dehydrogenase family)
MSSVASRLSGASAIVVGAGTPADGLSNGAACALLFAREGARVLCVDRSEEAAAETVRRISAEGGSASSYVADAQDSAQLHAMVEVAMARHGAVDVLHYNVGIEEFGELIDVTDASWDRVHAINLRGAMAAARAVMPHMMGQRRGSIILMSSVASRKWSPMQFLSYSTSKAALNHMARVVARQYAPHQVRCNTIVAGLIDTPHAASLFPDAAAARAGRQARIARCPMGRQGTAWDIAQAALFLASDASSYVTGLELVVDGGLTLG